MVDLLSVLTPAPRVEVPRDGAEQLESTRPAVAVETRQAGAEIDRLPPEVLSYIFTLCLPDDPLDERNSSESPQLLGRVSKFWRQLSISTPELWSSFQVQLVDTVHEPYSLFDTPPHVSDLHTWLGRSDSVPLSLGLSFLIMYSRMVQATGPLVEAMASYSHRCRYLSFRFGSIRASDTLSYFDYPLEWLPRHRTFPYLEEINMELPFLNAGIFLSTLFASAPRLRKIAVTGYPPSLLSFTPHPTFKQLTYIRTDARESVRTCCEVLRLCPNLRQCRYDTHPADDVTMKTPGKSCNQSFIGSWRGYT